MSVVPYLMVGLVITIGVLTHSERVSMSVKGLMILIGFVSCAVYFGIILASASNNIGKIPPTHTHTISSPDGEESVTVKHRHFHEPEKIFHEHE